MRAGLGPRVVVVVAPDAWRMYAPIRSEWIRGGFGRGVTAFGGETGSSGILAEERGVLSPMEVGEEVGAEAEAARLTFRLRPAAYRRPTSARVHVVDVRAYASQHAPRTRSASCVARETSVAANESVCMTYLRSLDACPPLSASLSLSHARTHLHDATSPGPGYRNAALSLRIYMLWGGDRRWRY